MIRGIKANGSLCCRIAIFSPDGRTIATAGVGDANGDLLLIDAGSGAMRLRVDAHESFMTCAAWCPYTGSKLVTVSYDGTKVWDSTTGTLLHSFITGGPIRSVAWGRDWVRDTQGAMAFAMGHHPRLGEESQVLELEAGVVRMILDRV